MKKIDILSMMNEKELKIFEEEDYDTEIEKIVEISNELENIDDIIELEDIKYDITTLIEDLEKFESIKEYLFELEDTVEEKYNELEEKESKENKEEMQYQVHEYWNSQF